MTYEALNTRFTEQLRLEESIRALQTPLQQEQQRLHDNKVQMLLDIMRETNSDGNRTMVPVPQDFWRYAAVGDKRPQRWVSFVGSMKPIWKEFYHARAHRTREEWQTVLLEAVGKPEKRDEPPTKAFVLVKEADLLAAFRTVSGYEPLESRFNNEILKVKDEEWPLVRYFQNETHQGWGVYFRPFHQKCSRESYHWMTDSLLEAQLVAMEISVRVQGAKSLGIPYTIPTGYHALPRYISPEDFFFKL